MTCVTLDLFLYYVLSQKFWKTIVTNQLVHFLENNRLLSNSQYGFRPKLSTQTVTTVTTDEIFKNMDSKKISLLTLCDFSKAFDSVRNKSILHKCSELNIDYFCFKNYLEYRSQSVRLNKALSDKFNIAYGDAQGSILRPVLFSIYVNDLSKTIKHCTLIQYADDTQFLYADTVNSLGNLIVKTEETLKNVKQYFARKGLLLNSKKRQCIFIGNRQLLSRIPPNSFINCDGEHIEPLTHVKNLGIYIDKHMLFDVHIEELGKTIIGILIFLNRVSAIFDKTTRLILVKSLVTNLINFCIGIWGSTSKTLLADFQKLLNFAAKVIVGGYRKYDHVSPILKELKWFTVNDMHVFGKCTTMYKAITGNYPRCYLHFPTVRDNSPVVTRQLDELLYITRVSTDCGGRTISVHDPRIWNSLPNSVTDSVTLRTFKSNLRKLLLCDL